MTKTSLSRRSFVQASLFAGAAAAIGASMAGCMEQKKAPTEAEAEDTPSGPVEPSNPRAQFKKVEYDEVVRTACHGCLGHCPVLAFKKNGVVVKLMGDTADGNTETRGSICPKCLNQLQTMYSPRRLLHPLRRAGERGENKWEIIS